jgi:osmoprotectant transport system permease protein
LEVHVTEARGLKANAITALGGAIGVLSAALPWLLFRPNRLVQGDALAVWQLGGPWHWLALVAWALIAVSAVWRSSLRGYVGTALLVGAIAAIALSISSNSGLLLMGAGEFARVSVSGGVWLMLVAVYVVAFGVGTEFRFATPTVLLALLATFAFGAYSRLGPAVEYAAVSDTFFTELLRHFALSIAAVIVAVVIGVPLALMAVRNSRLEGLVLGGAGLLQTIPSLALFGVLLAPLAWVGRSVSMGAVLAIVVIGALLSFAISRFKGVLPVRFALVGVTALIALPLLAVLIYNALIGNLAGLAAFVQPAALLSSAGIRGIGAAPALVALTIYALFPIVVNTFVGMKSVPEGVIDAARGMGMNQRQVFLRAELPIAIPAMLTGLRGATVLSFGLTTVAALIGGGGLGFFILRGVDANAPDLILVGAAPIVILALVIDAGLRAFSALVTPKGLR